MCGRFSLSTPPELLAALFGLGAPPTHVTARYNIAPTQQIAAVIRRASASASPTATSDEDASFSEDSAVPVLKMFRWGLIPFWAEDAAIGNRMINARGETVADKPAFRAAFRKRRCLIPADGFYEWQKRGDKSGKQPFHIHRRDGRPFAMAGLWECWRDPSPAPPADDTADLPGNPVEIFSCTIITTTPNELLEPIHDRMPVILDKADFARWLDTDLTDVTALRSLIKPAPADAFTATPVSLRVNRPANDDPACIEPLQD